MNEFLPPSNASPDIVTAYNLLALIADPAGVTKRLEELSTANANAQAVLDSVIAERQANQDILTQLNQTKDEVTSAQSVIDQQNDYLRNKEIELAHKETSLSSFERDLNTSAEAFKLFSETKDADLSSRERAVSARESVIDTRDSESKELNDKAQSLFQDYQTRLTQLKSIIN